MQTDFLLKRGRDGEEKTSEVGLKTREIQSRGDKVNI